MYLHSQEEIDETNLYKLAVALCSEPRANPAHLQQWRSRRCGGEVADAGKLNSILNYLDKTKGCTPEANRGNVTFLCPDGSRWIAARGPSLPEGPLQLELAKFDGYLQGQGWGFNPTVDFNGLEGISRALIETPSGAVLDRLSKTRIDYDTFKGPSNGHQLHSLCDPNIHVGYLAIEAVEIYQSGPNILAMRTLTVAESQDPDNASASVGCLKPKDGGGYETTLHLTLNKINGHGRFQCASGDPINRIYVLNEFDPSLSVALLGVNMSWNDDGRLYEANRIGQTMCTIIATSGVISVPAACD